MGEFKQYLIELLEKKAEESFKSASGKFPVFEKYDYEMGFIQGAFALSKLINHNEGLGEHDLMYRITRNYLEEDHDKLKELMEFFKGKSSGFRRTLLTTIKPYKSTLSPELIELYDCLSEGMK